MVRVLVAKTRLQILGRVTSQLQHLGGQVLCVARQHAREVSGPCAKCRANHAPTLV